VYHHEHNEKVYFFLVISMHIPAATVAPASLTANLDVNGFSY